MSIFDSIGAECAANSIARNMCQIGVLKLWGGDEHGVNNAMAAAQTNLAILARIMGYTLTPIEATEAAQ